MDTLFLLTRLAGLIKRFSTLTLIAVSVVLVILIIILMVIVFRMIRRSAVEVEETEEERARRLKKQRLAKIFSGLKLSFKSSLLFLRSKISDKEYRYQLPWFLILGESSSGRSEILRSLGLGEQVSGTEAEEMETNWGAQWWFYDKGAVIEPQGELILKANIQNPEDDEIFIEKGWQRLVKMLKKHRPKRPLDGVILTVSCSDLLGDGNFDKKTEAKSNLKWKAEILYDRLRGLQEQLAFYFPVYVVFTKCDQIVGFSPFCRQLPESLQNGILGWSNPYSLSTPYSADWPEEGMRDIDSSLFEAKLEFFTEKSGLEESQQISLLSARFNELLCYVKLFLDTLFQKSSFHDSFFFRGFFFSGSPADQTEIFKRPVFIKDLFNKKIFPERGLGKIVDKTFISKHRPVQLVQLTCVLVLLVGSLGLFGSYWSLAKEKRVDLPVLDLIASSLLELQYKKTVDRSMFEKEGLSVLNGMSEIDPFALTSIFMPSSWTSSLQSRIVSCMTVAYEKIIMRMMFIEFSNKVRDISLAEEDANEFEPKVGIRESWEFKQLRSFIEDLADLEKHLNIYNGRLVAGEASSEEFIQIVSYLYDIELKGPFSAEALSQLRGNPIMTESLRDDVNAKIWELANKFYKRAWKYNVLRRKLIALKKLLRNLHTKSFENIIEFYSVLSGDSSISQAWREGKSSGDNIVVRFKSLLAVLKDMEKDFANQEYAWIVSDRFDMFPEFRRVLELVWMSELLGKEVYEQLNKQGERGLKLLQHELSDQQTRLTGFFLVRYSEEERDASEDYKGLLKLKDAQPFKDDDATSSQEEASESQEEVPEEFTIEEAKALKQKILKYGKDIPKMPGFHVPIDLKYSDKVLTLKKALEDFFGMKFTNVARSHSRMLIDLPSGKRLIWNARLLKQAADLYEPFMVFLTEKLNNFPEELRPIFEQVAREILETNMADIIGRSQRMEDTLETVNPSFRQEMLRSEVLNFKDASPHISRLLEIFELLEFHKASRNMFRVTAIQGNRILRQVDQLLMEGDFYMVKNRDFDWWNGKKSPALAAYNVNDQEELKFYFSVQQKRIRSLVHDYAVPIINVLGFKNKHRGYIDLRLISRWERIITAFGDFEKKKPGNSIDVLETFILSGLDEIAGKDCDKEIPAEVLTAKSGDFFLNQRNVIRKRLYRRCQRLAFENDFKTY